MAEDSRRFASTFEEPIAAAATHIYVSALSFCPSDSWIARLYGPRSPNRLSVTSGGRVNWDTAATTSDGHDDWVTSAAFFPDGRKLASGSDGLYCARVGYKHWPSNFPPLSLDILRWVTSVAVSPDGKHIASGSWDGILRIFDSNTGVCPLGPIAAHRGTIYSVAFSPDGSRIVTGSLDNTLKVWNAATGDLCLGPLTGHTDDVRSVAFSPDGTCIASGSSNKTIRIWDASTGGISQGTVDWAYRCGLLCRILCRQVLSSFRRFGWQDNLPVGRHSRFRTDSHRYLKRLGSLTFLLAK